MILVTRWTVRSVFYLHSPSRFFLLQMTVFFLFCDLFRRTPWWRSKRRRCRWLSRTSKLRSDCVRVKTPALLRPSKTRSKGAWVTSMNNKVARKKHISINYYTRGSFDDKFECNSSVLGPAWEGGLWHGSCVLQRGLQEVGKQTRKWLLHFRFILWAAR